MGAFFCICSQHGIDFGLRCFHGPKGWKQSDAQRYVCDLIHTMDSTWPVQEVFRGWWSVTSWEGWFDEQRCFYRHFCHKKLQFGWWQLKHVFFFNPTWGDNPISLITHIFQMGWNHQLAMNWWCPLAKHFVPPLHPEVSRCIDKKELWNWALFERQIPKLSLNISHDFGDECSCILK